MLHPTASADTCLHNMSVCLPRLPVSVLLTPGMSTSCVSLVFKLMLQYVASQVLLHSMLSDSITISYYSSCQSEYADVAGSLWLYL